MAEISTVVIRTHVSRPTGWSLRTKLIVAFWAAALITLAIRAYTEDVGWDVKYSSDAIQLVHHGIDPYAASILSITKAIQNRPALGAALEQPRVYQYPPLTLPLLRLLSTMPSWLLGAAYAAMIAAGALLQLWAGFHMGSKGERRWLALALPAVIFFPGLITDDVILSGNIAYILYGMVFAAAVPGWKRGKWLWFYVAVVASSMFKLPFLSLLAIPVLLDRRQWINSGLTAASGVFIFGMQALLWPMMFREYLQTLRLMSTWGHDFGYGPAGVLQETFVNLGMPVFPAAMILYVLFVGVLGIAYLYLARRIRESDLPVESWVPLVMLGTLLLNPRIKKYDLAAFSIPMLLIAWRALERASEIAARRNAMAGLTLDRFRPVRLAFAALCFVIPNVVTVTGPTWFPGELLAMLAIFALGLHSVAPTPAEAPALEEIEGVPLAPEYTFYGD